MQINQQRLSTQHGGLRPQNVKQSPLKKGGFGNSRLLEKDKTGGGGEGGGEEEIFLSGENWKRKTGIESLDLQRRETPGKWLRKGESNSSEI